MGGGGTRTRDKIRCVCVFFLAPEKQSKLREKVRFYIWNLIKVGQILVGWTGETG